MRYAQKTNQRRISKSLEGQSANVIGQKVQKIAIFGWYIDREFWNDRRELLFWKWSIISSFFPRRFLSENLPAILDWFTIRFSCLLLIHQLESLFHVLLNHRNFFSVGTHLRIKDLVKPRKIWTSQEIQDTRHLVEDNGPDDLQTKSPSYWSLWCFIHTRNLFCVLFSY